MRPLGVALLATAWLAGVAHGAAPPETSTSPEQARESMRRMIAFLVKDQNADGSWGGPRSAVYTFTGDVWSNPETHRSWKVGTSGLCVLALLHTGSSEDAGLACDRGLTYLLRNADVKRPSDWDTMNCWAHIYGLQALAAAYTHPRYAGNEERREKIRAASERHMASLSYHQAASGGWGYLEFDAPRTVRPQWSTSFTTAAAIVAMVDARDAGLKIDEAVLNRAMRAVEHCRLPTGAFTYSVPVITQPGGLEWIDQIKGSLCRITACNVALKLAGMDVPVERMRKGMSDFFREHRFLDIARNKPVPHENYYYNSGYFYLFGHYYAARMIEMLPEAERAALRGRLWYEIVKIQQRDGSVWDYDMHAYHKPYGSAFGLLALEAALRVAE